MYCESWDTAQFIGRFFQRKIERFTFYFKKYSFKFSNTPKKNEWFLISPYGIGDTYLILSHLKEFRLQNNVNKLILGIVKESHGSIIKLFPDVVDKVVILDDFKMKYCEKNEFGPGYPIVLHSEHFLSNSMQSVMGYKGITLNDSYKLLLNIDINSDNIRPHISQELKTKAKKKFSDYGLKEGKTVLIAPNAVTINDTCINPLDWVYLSKELHNRGYDIAFLSNQIDYQSISFAKSVTFEISETVPFIDLCGYFISLRSGICDVSFTANCHKYILYPNQKWFSSSLFSCTSLNLMYNNVNNLKEFIIDEISLKNTLLHVIEEIENEK